MESAISDDDVVMKLDPQKRRSFFEPGGYFAIVFARRQIT